MGASDFSKLPHIGESVRRKEDYRFLTGAGQYTDDIVLAAQSFAVFVRSPHAHANVISVDVAAAKAAPGVIGVFTGPDVAADNINGFQGTDNTLWRKLISSPDALRQRVMLALSEIFVISMAGLPVAWRSFVAASYVDVLETRAFGTYRALLEAVTLSPGMGVYLNMRGNQKEDTATGRVPDELLNNQSTIDRPEGAPGPVAPGQPPRPSRAPRGRPPNPSGPRRRPPRRRPRRRPARHRRRRPRPRRPPPRPGTDVPARRRPVTS